MSLLMQALRKVLPGDHEIRVIEGRAYAALPASVGAAALSELQRSIGTPLTIVEVEMGLGLRGADLSAGSRVLPGPEDTDLTDSARETLHEWLADAAGPGFDEDEAAFELAFSLLGEEEEGESDAADDAGTPAEEVWARRFLDKLIADKGIEMRSKLLPVSVIAGHLESWLTDEDENPEELAELGEALLDELVGCDAVDEVFVDEAVLIEAVRATRPSRCIRRAEWGIPPPHANHRRRHSVRGRAPDRDRRQPLQWADRRAAGRGCDRCDRSHGWLGR